MSNSPQKSKRLYKCGYCNTKFRIQKLLQAHLKQVHECDAQKNDKKRQIKSSKKSKNIPIEGKKYFVEYQLPYGWKKVGSRRSDSDRWDFYVYGPNGKKFRSNVEIQKYLDMNPEVKCDRDVTNTSRIKNSQNSPTKRTPENKSGDAKKTQFSPSAARYQNSLKIALKIDELVKKPEKFICNECGSLFKYNSGLKRHLEAKRCNLKNFQCDLCNYVSARKDNLKKHVQSVHEKLKPYNCRQCGKAFSMKQHCKEHEESIHDGITHSCDFCEMTFTTNGHLRTHIKSSDLCKKYYSY